MFYLPISQEATAELTILEGWLLNLQRDPLLPDQWVWPSKSGSFSAKGFYTIMHSHMPTIMPCKWLWKSRCTMKIKVFGWLLFFDRLNTKDMLVRRHCRSQAEDNLCVLCNAYVHEDRFHLFFQCNFSSRVWNYLQIDWSQGSNIQECVAHARSSFSQKIFFEVMLTAAWNIWILRNGRIFRGEQARFATWRCNFVHDILLLSHRLNSSLRTQLLAWVNALL